MPVPPTPPRTATRPGGRADTIAAGLLIDLDPRLTRPAGIPVPVAITPAAWTAAVAPNRPTADPAEGHATLRRALDVLQAARAASAQHPAADVSFTVWVSRRGDGCEPVTLTAHPDRGDCGEPVLTITTTPPPPTRAFRIAGAEGTWPTLHYLAWETPEAAPVVTVEVLRVVIAHALDAGRLAAVRVDADSDTLRVCDRHGHVAALRPAGDGGYDLAPMRRLGWAFLPAE